MYIPVSILIIIFIIWLYKRDKVRDEISSLRGDIQDIFRQERYNPYEDYDEDKKVTKDVIKKDEYTFEESQDREKLGVRYDDPFEKIKESYLKQAKEYQSTDVKKFTEITGAFKRLEKKLKP